MAFSDIRIDDDVSQKVQGGMNGEERRQPAYTNALGSGGQDNVGSNGLLRVTPDMSCGEFVRQCTKRYHFQFSWNVAFPQQPRSPLLYSPTEYNHLLRNPEPMGVMQSELDAMAEGLLDRIPLAHYLFNPSDVRTVKEVIEANEQNRLRLQRKNEEAGHVEQTVWSPRDVNLMLEEEDWELLDVDYDQSLVLQRDLPSLTLMQRPLYTDIGLVSQEVRHAQRLSRIVPPELRSQTQGSLSQAIPHSPSSPMPGGSFPSGLSQGNLFTQASLEAAGSPTGPTPGNVTNRERQMQWQTDVSQSFRYVRALEEQFKCLLKSIARTKLGLDDSNEANVEFARRLWKHVLTETPREHQSVVWNKICQFSLAYNPSSSSSMNTLRTDLLQLHLPHWNEWCTLLENYEELLQKYISGPNKKQERESRMNLSISEMNPIPTKFIEPVFGAKEKIPRRVGKDIGSNMEFLPIFPVEVIPVYPSSFNLVAKGMLDPDSSDLAEHAASLHHVELPGGHLGERSRLGGPHVLINGNNLLLADDCGNPGEEARGTIQPGATISYSTSRDNTYEPLFSDEDNTSSYLFRLSTLRSFSGGTAPLNPKGITNVEGNFIVYDRIGSKDMFVKAPDAPKPPFDRYVLLFDEDEEEEGSGEASSKKHQQETHAEGKRMREADVDAEDGVDGRPHDPFARNGDGPKQKAIRSES